LPPVGGDGAPPALAEWRQVEADLDDGPSARAAIGLIVLENDITIEREVHRLLPDEGVGLYVGRIGYPPPFGIAAIRAMEERLPAAAAAVMPDDRLDVMAFGCTACAMTLGAEAVDARIHETRPGIAVTDPVRAALKGLRALGAKRIAMLTPYPDEVNGVVARYMAEQGFEVIAGASFRRQGDADIARTPPAAVRAAARELARSGVDAVFASGTAMRAAAAIQAIEDETGIPVVSSNQALAWDCLRLAGCMDPVPRFGRLMTL